MNAGHDFHLRIAEIAGHGWASRLHAQVDGQMARYRAFTNQSPGAPHRPPWPSTARSSRPCVARDAERARALAEAHVLAARDTALDAIADRLDAVRA